MNEQVVWSNDDEYFIYDSLQELLSQEEGVGVGATVSFGEKEDADVSTLVDADDVVEMIGERAYDNFGESAEDFPGVSLEAKQELNLLLSQWIVKNCQASFYWIRNVQSYVVTEEDIKENT